jgi:hypothetical protein
MIELPPLPEAAMRFVVDQNGVSVYPDYFEADQMRAYGETCARAAIEAASRMAAQKDQRAS